MSDSKPHSAIHAENFVPDNTNGTKDKKKVRYIEGFLRRTTTMTPKISLKIGEKDQYFKLERWFECDRCS